MRGHMEAIHSVPRVFGDGSGESRLRTIAEVAERVPRVFGDESRDSNHRLSDYHVPRSFGGESCGEMT